MKNFDLIIVGQTISGLALACGLPRDFKIAILNTKCSIQNSNINVNDFISVSIISIAVSYLLRFLNVWDNCIMDKAAAYYAVDIREEDSFNNLFFNKSYLGYPSLGYIINTSIIYRSLLYRAHTFENIVFIDNFYCCKTEIIDGQNSLSIIINNQCCLLAKLLVMTVTCTSLLNKNLGIPITSWHYPYNILYGTVFSDKSHKNILRYVFQEKNILTLLPLIESNTSCLFGLLFADFSDNFLTTAIDKEYWNDFFLRSFYELGIGNFKDSVNIFPCIAQFTRSSLIDRLLLLGHVAYDISPFKYQNTNFDLMDVAFFLGEVYKFEKNFNIDIGNATYLKSYEMDRRCRIIKMFGKIQCMREFFSGENCFKQCVRASIFRIINKMLPIISTSDVIHSIIGFDDIPSWLLSDYLNH